MSSPSVDKPFVVTFRSHHNAYGDEGATIVRVPAPPTNSLWYTLIQNLWGFTILHYFFWFIPMLAVLLLVYILLHPLVAILMVGIYSYKYFKKDELTGKRTWDWFRNIGIWRSIQHYHQLEVVREVELDPKEKYIFGFHPHGIMILSRATTYAGIWEKLFPGIIHRCLAATPLFTLPGCRDIALWTGGVRADRSNAIRILNSAEKDRKSLVVYPGGSTEIFHTSPTSKEITLIARKGFIRLALQTGSHLVPTFVFGEKYAYYNTPIPAFVQNFFMSKMRTPLTLFWGKWRTWLPMQGGKYFLSIVYGKPIPVNKVTEPSDEEVEELYTKFYQEISNLFHKYKDFYGHEEDFLTIKMASSK